MKVLPPEERCQHSVCGDGPWGAFHPHQCYKKSTVIRDGKRYCTVHDPERVAAKNEEADRKYREESNKRQEVWKRWQLLNRVFEGIETATIESKFTYYRDAVVDI